jgi:hypothetical protein
LIRDISKQTDAMQQKIPLVPCGLNSFNGFSNGQKSRFSLHSNTNIYYEKTDSKQPGYLDGFKIFRHFYEAALAERQKLSRACAW